jgi:hypothetical protein
MDWLSDQIFFIIIIILILGIYYIHIQYSSQENFSYSSTNNINGDDINECNPDLLTLNPYQRCNVLGVKKFMIRDLRTKLWLTSGQEEGFNKFLPGRFGVPLVMSENPDEYLPLRTVADPNDYLLATYKGNGIRTVSNPYTKYFIIQVFIYEGYNILGYIDEGEKQRYLYIDDDGHVSSTSKPNKASIIEIVEI